MGGKSSTQSTSSPYSPILANWAHMLMNTWQPVQNQLASQAGEALRTGGVNAQIPIISRAVDAARQGASQTEEQTRQALARSGTSGPEAQSILSQERMSEGDRINAIPTDIASSFIGQAPEMASRGTGQAIGLLTGAAGSDYTQRSTPSFWDSFSQGLSGIGNFGTSLGALGASSGWFGGSANAASSWPIASAGSNLAAFGAA